eukprot:6209821-Pleurochrysis_carterae.AAC.2
MTPPSRNTFERIQIAHTQLGRPTPPKSLRPDRACERAHRARASPGERAAASPRAAHGSGRCPARHQSPRSPASAGRAAPGSRAASPARTRKHVDARARPIASTHVPTSNQPPNRTCAHAHQQPPNPHLTAARGAKRGRAATCGAEPRSQAADRERMAATRARACLLSSQIRRAKAQEKDLIVYRLH